jgi:hypothetical protein
MNRQSVPKFASLAAIATLIERNPSSLSRICTKARIRARKSDGLFSVAKVLTAIEEATKRDLRNQPGAGTTGDLKSDKLREEIGILKLKRGELEKTLIPMDEHLSELRTFSGWVNDALAQWVSAVKVLTADARVTGEAERLRDKCRAMIEEKIKGELP